MVSLKETMFEGHVTLVIVHYRLSYVQAEAYQERPGHSVGSSSTKECTVTITAVTF